MVKLLRDLRREQAKERNKAKVRRNKRLRYCPLKDTMVYEMRCTATINSDACKHLGFKGCNLAKKKRICPKLPKETYEDGSQHGQQIGYGKCLKCPDFDKENDQCKLKERKKPKTPTTEEVEETLEPVGNSENEEKTEDFKVE